MSKAVSILSSKGFVAAEPTARISGVYVLMRERGFPIKAGESVDIFQRVKYLQRELKFDYFMYVEVSGGKAARMTAEKDVTIELERRTGARLCNNDHHIRKSGDYPCVVYEFIRPPSSPKEDNCA